MKLNSLPYCHSVCGRSVSPGYIWTHFSPGSIEIKHQNLLTQIIWMKRVIREAYCLSTLLCGLVIENSCITFQEWTLILKIQYIEAPGSQNTIMQCKADMEHLRGCPYWSKLPAHLPEPMNVLYIQPKSWRPPIEKHHIIPMLVHNAGSLLQCTTDLSILSITIKAHLRVSSPLTSNCAGTSLHHHWHLGPDEAPGAF